MPGRPAKKFTDYIRRDISEVCSLDDYAASPASTFCEEIVDISDAVAHCIRNFPKKTNAELTEASEDSLGQITAATLGTIMGHFELYQRFTFSTAFELTRHLPNFDFKNCARDLTKDSGLNIDVSTLMAYRGQPAPIGQLVADNLHSWHDPDKVNRYFKAIFSSLNFYSSQEADSLRVLWQLRHSMVHTGGWLTLPDAQKVHQLRAYGGQGIFLSENFTEVVARRLHQIVARATSRLDKAMAGHFPSEILTSDEYKKFVAIKSPRRVWLR